MPVHVYFFPELWAVQVVDNFGEEPVFVDRLFVDRVRLPQVLERGVDEFEPPVDTSSFYVLGVGFVFVKAGRIGFKKSFFNVRSKFYKVKESLFSDSCV